MNGITGTVAAGVFLLLTFVPAAISAEENIITIDTAETAGISGLAASWDAALPGATTADAVHRSVLVRFPGSAERIAEQLAKGSIIARVEVVFDYDGYELMPQGYTARRRDVWQDDPPQWHYVAWHLRRSWTASSTELAPTFNAWLGGAGYWASCGARDESADRYPTQFGPAELSLENTEARMDVTAIFTDDTYGETLGRRLRSFEEQGLLVKKWETYDHRYLDWTSYEWAVPTGGHGLTFKNPRLVVHLANGAAQTVELPPPADLEALAQHLKDTGEGGQPTAVMFDEEEVKRIAERTHMRQPEWMPDWQWERVQELRRIGGGRMAGWVELIEAGDIKQYRNLVNTFLSYPPRYWQMWEVQEHIIFWRLYNHELPEYVRDHIKNFWRSWLYPDRENPELISPHGEPKRDWYREHRDWRGVSSFFRSHYTHHVGTMNFNHVSIMGALLGGEIIDEPIPTDDGRSGFEKMLLRFYNYADGSSQEMLDDYYLSITLSAQKVFADYGPTHFDRLAGEMILDRKMELLISAFHPHVRQMIGASGRVLMANVLGFTQEGIYSALHTLTPRGVLFHTNVKANEKRKGISFYGHDLPPGRVAVQSMEKPWAPLWAQHQIYDKPLPFEITAADTTRGNFRDPPLWFTLYFGNRYGIASQDIKGGTADIVCQWNPFDEPAASAEQLGTLTVRYSVNEPDMTNTSGGTLPYAGPLVVFQNKNRAIVTSKPRTEQEELLNVAGGGVKSLSTTVALWHFREDSGWKLFVDDRQITELPVKLRFGQVVTLQDGPVYIGIIPMPAMDLGRQDEVVIRQGVPTTLDSSKDVTLAPAILIESFNMQRADALPADSDLWERVAREVHGGYIIEIGEQQEYGSFEAFQRRMRANRFETRWAPEERTLHVRYNSGEDLMEMAFCTAHFNYHTVHMPIRPGQHRQTIPYRRVNGEDPFLPRGIVRDTTLAQQGSSGRLEKNGAVLTMEAGYMAYLQTEPVTGTYTGYNPLPDLTPWTLTVPGGVEVRADGRLGMARVSVRPAERKLWIDYAYKPHQLEEEGIARRLLVFGLDAQPGVIVNGRKLDGEIETAEIDGRTAYAIPLDMRE